MKKIFKKEFYGKTITVEVDKYAKQANGSVLVRYEDTAVLTAAVMSKKSIDADFFPLTVLYQEKLYAVGKIPGGFIKREGKPTDNSTLTSRLIDRTLRPLFDEGFRNEVQVINTVLSVDKDNSPEMMGLFGSSLALLISDIPYSVGVAGVIVGLVDDKFIINPSMEQLEKSSMELVVSGTSEAINMVEASSSEVSEEVMVDALMFAHEAIKELILFEEEVLKEVGKEKISVDLKVMDDALVKEISSMIDKDLKKAILTFDKQERATNVDNVFDMAKEKLSIREDYLEIEPKLKEIFHYLEAMEVRRLIVEEEIRPDKRGLDEIRPLACEIDLLPRPHGSAMFTRGQTQVLSVVTLGALGEHQILDGLEIEEKKRFMHHYNFPAFSVGETRRYGPVGRREVGHGSLGEKALLQILPSEEEFPYTIRVVSEVLESNGSSSQASICASSMALMAAGVPVKSGVAGIAMGLITNDDNYKILTDIQGLEDHMGDMDFKVAGTSNGICALQMDIKIKGVTKEILEEALEKAKAARLSILDTMAKEISTPKESLSKYAPKIRQIKINPDKIKDVIGRGGEVITKLILDVSGVSAVTDPNAVKIDIEDDGRVIVYHSDEDIINKTITIIENLTREVIIGNKYLVSVVSVVEFGCFVEIFPGVEGLVHVSELDKTRVEKVSDVVSVGDMIEVIATGYDKKGKINLSRKKVLLENEEPIKED